MGVFYWLCKNIHKSTLLMCLQFTQYCKSTTRGETRSVLCMCACASCNDDVTIEVIFTYILKVERFPTKFTHTLCVKCAG